MSVVIPAELVRALDDLVHSGQFRSRADAVRTAIESLVEQERRRALGRRIVEGYRRIPQEEYEFPELTQAAVRSII